MPRAPLRLPRIIDRLSGEGIWATTAAWGRNSSDEEPTTDAFLIETNFSPAGPYVFFARAELVRKIGQDLAVDETNPALRDRVFTVGQRRSDTAGSLVRSAACSRDLAGVPVSTLFPKRSSRSTAAGRRSGSPCSSTSPEADDGWGNGRDADAPWNRPERRSSLGTGCAEASRRVSMSTERCNTTRDSDAAPSEHGVLSRARSILLVKAWSRWQHGREGTHSGATNEP